MSSSNTNNVADAFDVLLEEIEVEISLTDKAGAQAFEKRTYGQVRKALERAEQLVAFRDKALALRLDWEEAFGSASDALTDGDEKPGAATALDAFRAACLARVEKHLKNQLVRKSATSYATADGKVVVICAVSKEHTHTGQPRYWFALHTYHAELLTAAAQGHLALGCGSPDQLLFVPYAAFRQWLDSLNTTNRNDGVYWHIHVLKREGRLDLDRKKGFADVDLTGYLLGSVPLSVERLCHVSRLCLPARKTRSASWATIARTPASE